MQTLLALLLLVLAACGCDRNVDQPDTTVEPQRLDSRPAAADAPSDDITAAKKAPQPGFYTWGLLLLAGLCGLIGSYFWLKQQFRGSRLFFPIAALSGLLGLGALIKHAHDVLGFEDFIEVIESMVTVAAVLVGGGYYLFAIGFQKTYQRLEGVLSCSRLAGSDQVLIVFVVKNEAEVRILLQELVIEIEPSMPGAGRPKFNKNLETQISGKSREFWSVDAKSSTRFEATAAVDPMVSVVSLTVAFLPDLTQDKYTIRQTCQLGAADAIPSSGE